MRIKTNCTKHDNLPYINKITFLESLDIKFMTLDGVRMELESGYSKIMDSLCLSTIEICRKRITSSVKGIYCP